MVLSQLNDKARGFTARLPEVWNMMRESRAFMRSIDPFMYWIAWLGEAWSGVAALGAFASVGLVFKASSNGLLEKYFDLSHMTWTKVLLAITGIIALYLGRAVMSGVGRLRHEVLRLKIIAETERQNTTLLASLDVGRLSDPEFKRLQNRARTETYSGINNPYRDLYRSQCVLFRETIGLGASIGVIALLDPMFIFFAILPVIFELVKDVLEDNKRRDLWQGNYLVKKMMHEYHRCLIEIPMLLQGKLLRHSDYWLSRYRELNQEVLRRERLVDLWDFKWGLVTSTTGMLSLVLVLLYLGHRIVLGETGFSDVFFLWGSMQTLSSALSGFGNKFVGIRRECIEVEYRRQFLATKPLIDESNATRYRFQATPRLELRGVSFRYPRTEELILTNCSLTIASGEKVALVGENGSGKTTILRLLAKVYAPDEGSVTADTISLARVTQACWFEQLLYSTQEKEVPDFILEEALTGALPGTADYERLAKAASYSRADFFIQGLPNKYRTQLGMDWDEGWEPSGGQEQRLKLASAFYRLLEPSVRIALVDEPMSECDIQTRSWFYESLRSMQGKTIVVVAHDPMYLHCFDRVVLIDKGRVVRELHTREDIEAYQREAIPRYEDAERKNNLRIV